MSENNLQDLHKLIDDTNGNLIVIKPFEKDDLRLGEKISASVTEGGHFSQISIGNRNYVFSRKTGEWAGNDIDCVSEWTQEEGIQPTKKCCFMEEGYIYVDAFEKIMERLKGLEGFAPLACMADDIPAKCSIRRGDGYPAYDYNEVKSRLLQSINSIQTVLSELEGINNQDCIF